MKKNWCERSWAAVLNNQPRDGDLWGKKVSPEGMVMWVGGTLTRRKTAGEKSSEIDAIAKSSDDRGLGEGFSGVRDAEIGSEERDEASDGDLLGLKAMKQLVARQPGRGATVGGPAD